MGAPFLYCNAFTSAGDDGEGTAGPKFGHLHVVFRDWNYSGTAEDVSAALFATGVGVGGVDREGGGRGESKVHIQRVFLSHAGSLTILSVFVIGDMVFSWQV